MSFADRFPRRAVPAVALLLVLPLLGGCSLVRRRMANRPPYKTLSPPIAYELMRDNPEMLVIDLRSPHEYNGETGHVRRALNIPLERLPYRMLEIGAFRDDTVLIYCRADDCAEKGIALLLSSGFDSLVLLDGGIDAWIRKGFKTVLPATSASQAPKPGEGDGRGVVMPTRPGKPQLEMQVKPPRPPGPGVAAPRQIG